MTLAAWVLSLIVSLQPAAPWRATYETTADAIARVVLEEAPLFADDAARTKTAALLVSVAYFEGSFNPHARGRLGELGEYQAMPGKLAPEARQAGFVDDVELQTRVALRMLRESFVACRTAPLEERLAFYASGSCDRGLRESRNRVSLAKRLAAKHPAP